MTETHDMKSDALPLPDWLLHCTGALQSAHEQEADYLVYMGEDADTVHTGLVILASGAKGEIDRRVYEKLTGEGLAVRIGDPRLKSPRVPPCVNGDEVVFQSPKDFGESDSLREGGAP